MKTSALKYAVLTWISGISMLILLVMPFHAFLTVWLSSLIGHYTALRLWKEVLLVLTVIGAAYLLLTDHKIRYHTLSRRLVWVILAYIGLNVIWGLLALNQHDVTLKALGYGLIVNLRCLIFFLITWSAALRLARLRTNWQWLVLVPAIGVVVIGLLQIFVLPHDFLRHFGYGDKTIPAIETINHNTHYIRIMSTLRGANPLGAYMIIPISLLTVLLIRNGRNWRQGLLLIASVVVLFYSFSRSAWIGAVLSVLTILALSRLSAKTQKYALVGVAATVLVVAGLALAFRNSQHFQNFVLHTQSHSAVKTTSNGGHLTALKSGLHDLVHSPLGDGPGTAGPASFYNTGHPERVAENYFIQVGQETGWLGLVLFILINVGVGYLLFLRRDDPLALSLFGALIGLTFVNLLSHAWTDDTLAYVWWGLAGVAMAPNPQIKGKAKDEPAKNRTAVR